MAISIHRLTFKKGGDMKSMHDVIDAAIPTAVK
jgi:hypothetical protein